MNMRQEKDIEVAISFNYFFIVVFSAFLLQPLSGSWWQPGSPGAQRHGQFSSNASKLFGLKTQHMFFLWASPKHQLKEEKFRDLRHVK